MSYTIIQQPDEYSLSAQVKDFVLESDADIAFEILQGDDSLLSETYTPDVSGRVCVRDLARFFSAYLSGSDFGEAVHSGILGTFTVKVNSVQLPTQYKVLLCNAVTEIPAGEFVTGNVFLNLMKRVKRIMPTSTEYLTCNLANEITVFVTSLVDGVPVNSDEVPFNTAKSSAFTTLNVGFSQFASLFPGIDPETILAVRIRTGHQIYVMMVDRATYLLPIEFAFKNYFDVPETLITRGNVSRKGATTFDTAKVNRVKIKYNVVRDDPFEVSSGKLFSLDDYDRYREMFNSEDVRILFNGKWRKIIITEENLVQSLRAGNLQPVSFTFQFADPNDNNLLCADAFMRWILEYGKYEDGKVWVDDGHWIDN